MKKTLKLISVIMAMVALCMLVASCVEGKYDTDATGHGTSVRMTDVKKEIDSKKVEDFVAADGKTD